MQKKTKNKTKQNKENNNNNNNNNKKKQQKPWEYTHYENIILLTTGLHRAVGRAMGTSPYNIVS